jgi:hypothetical protein
MNLFEPEARATTVAELVARARDDVNIVSAALVGSLASGSGDRWSDVDLSFGVAPGVALEPVIRDWTEHLASAYRAAALFDLQARGTHYRVFLLPGCLQIDLSFSPGGDVFKASPRFRQLFGSMREVDPIVFDARDAVGWAIHLAHAARVNVERGKPQQAEWCLTELRGRLFSLHCALAGAPTAFGKGRDRLAPATLARFERMLVRSLDLEELERVLSLCVTELRAYDGPGSELGRDVADALAWVSSPRAA